MDFIFFNLILIQKYKFWRLADAKYIWKKKRYGHIETVGRDTHLS